ESGSDEAFTSTELELTHDVAGDVSVFHSVTGVHLVRALIRLAMSDVATAQTAIDGFVDASRRPCKNPDLTLGRASTLLGCAALYDAAPLEPPGGGTRPAPGAG